MDDRTKIAARLVGPYLLGRRIGGGGMGEVFEATHRTLGRRVAIKRMRRGGSGDIERFFAEARLAASIHHRGIVDILDVGADEFGHPYIVMEMLHGADLALTMIRRESFSEAEIIEIGLQITEALGAAHARGIIHRDLKPENVFLVDSDHGPQVKLLDFGVAKDEDSELTVAGQVLGTPQYMAPEQHWGASFANQRSDLYSLGCLLYEMATGRPPFLGLGAEIRAKHHSAAVRRPRARGAEISAELEAIIMKLLRKDRDKRFANAGEVLRALTKIRPDRRTPRLTVRRPPRWRYAIARVAIGLLAGLAITAAASAVVNAQSRPEAPAIQQTKLSR